jgi:anti-sigma B factor antagonist
MWTEPVVPSVGPATASPPDEVAGRYEITDHVVVWARGEIDLVTTPPLRRELTAAVSRTPAKVIVDLTEVSFMDSSGVYVLISALRTAQRGGGSVCLVGACRTVERVLVLSGLDALFPLHATLQQALSARQTR